MPRQVDHEERRDAMSHAVWQVVSDSGLEGLTLRAVATAAGCTTGMVTHYFAGKKELLAHARSEMHRRMAARIDTLPAGESARDALYIVAEQALPLDDERHLEAAVWSQFLLSTRNDPALLAEHTRSHASWIDRLTTLVAAAHPDHLERAELENRVRSLVACLDGLALNAVTDPGSYPPDIQRRVLDIQLDLILEGNRTP
ncbi:TetR family transcriptional regulator C-terminal domain-containing protein [Streptomyces sp. NPDC006235]|uniref:TetR/AcrR family transcriptional regulator n=1 Tax=Streptomyces sp. NPDC006235 TaxID=3156736 RepID=UPI0033A99557